MTPQEQTVPVCRYCGPECPVGYGYCHCGCGGMARIATRDRDSKGWIKGLPQRFIDKHRSTFRQDFSDAAPFKLNGHYCKLIPLTRGMYAIVWASDYKRISKFRWRAHWGGFRWYAVWGPTRKNGEIVMRIMHREVMRLSPDDPREPDHIDRDQTLNNAQDNLQVGSHSQNLFNQKTRTDNSLGIAGIFRKRNKFGAQIVRQGKIYRKSGFKTIEEAVVYHDYLKATYHKESIGAQRKK